MIGQISEISGFKQRAQLKEFFLRYFALSPLSQPDGQQLQHSIVSIPRYGDADTPHVSRFRNSGIVVGKSSHQVGISGTETFLSY
jgi:hypothetical protein